MPSNPNIAMNIVNHGSSPDTAQRQGRAVFPPLVDPLDPTRPDTGPLERAIGRLNDRLYGLQELAGVALSEPLREAFTEVEGHVGSLTRSLTWARDEAQARNAESAAAQSLVAQMHAAAVGGVTGPRRGVVEDVEDVAALAVTLQTRLAEQQTQLEDVEAHLLSPAHVAAEANAAALKVLLSTVERWKRAGVIHPDTANRALRAARHAGDDAAAQAGV